MVSSYWDKFVAARVSRRRAIAVTAGTAGAAVMLAACGGGSDSSESGDSSGLLTKAVDTTNKAKRGGTYVINLASDPQHLDPHVTLGGSSRAYSLLLNQRSGHLEQPDGTYQGEAAEAFEFSPDGLQVTFKLRSNAPFHNIAPVNGRQMDSSDVMYSWKRYEAT